MLDGTTMAQPLIIGTVTEDWSGDAQFYEYSKAADPIGTGLISSVPLKEFPASLYNNGATRMVSLDLSSALGTAYPATSPSLLAQFIRIRANESIQTQSNATSELYYVIEGRGQTEVHDQIISWQVGDIITLPAGSYSHHRAWEDASLYYISDAPLLSYLGVRADRPQFDITKYDGRLAKQALDRVLAEPDAKNRNRISILLNNSKFDQTLTITHTLWAMLGIVPAGANQLPHRHNSVALDLVIDSAPGTFTLVGEKIDPETKMIVDPIRVDWEAGKAFVTPPGMWHSHHNPTATPSFILPIQDAGLHTYLRTLDIQFQKR